MPRHDPQARLRHTLEYAREAIVLMRDKTRIWSTVTEDLPPLIAELEKIL
jgi:uncharacterized protein with HEPN domain